jgi:hypothetical protein
MEETVQPLQTMSFTAPLFAPVAVASALLFGGCTPRVELHAPAEPITINMNVKIDHEVRVRVDKELESVINKDSTLF